MSASSASESMSRSLGGTGAAIGPYRKSRLSLIRHILHNQLYIGVVLYGKKSAAPSDWIRAELPHLRIVDEGVWQAVQVRKAKPRAHYLRAPDGRVAPRLGSSQKPF